MKGGWRVNDRLELTERERERKKEREREGGRERIAERGGGIMGG